MKTIAFLFAITALFNASAQAEFFSCSMMSNGFCADFDIAGASNEDIAKGAQDCADNGGVAAAAPCQSGYELSCEMENGKAYLRFYNGFPQNMAEQICQQNGGRLIK